MARDRIVDFFRDPSTGNGISGRTVSLRKHSDASEITTTTTDANGQFVFSDTDVGYPGPVYYAVDDGSGTYKRHSSKSMGPIGPTMLDAVLAVFQGFGKGVMTGLAVTADGLSMDVSVSAGIAILKDGIPYYSDAAQTVTIAAADGTNPRIDLVVLRVTRVTQSEEGKIELTTVVGTPAASPTAPSATASASADDLVLAEVLVDAGATTIAGGKVTDRRDDAGQEVMAIPMPVSALDGVTATAAEINLLDGVTASTAELNILDGVTATAAELNALDGITATVTELNYTDGVTSAIQTQIDAKADVAGETFTGPVTVASSFSTSGTTNLATASGITTFYGRIAVAGSTPSVALGSAAGTGGSAAASLLRGRDTCGEVSVVTGASGVGTGTLATVTFGGVRDDTDYEVFFQATSINASDLNLSLSGRATTGFDIRANSAPGTGETLNIAYWVMEV